MRDLALVLFYKNDSSLSMETVQVLEQMKQESPEIPICAINVAEVKDIHPRYQVTSVPTVLAFRHHKPAEVIKGRQGLGYYKKLLREFHAELPADNAKANRVTVYTTPTCHYCTAVKSYLKEKSVAFKEVNIAADPSAAQSLMARTGQQGVPQIDINGNWVVGFNRPELNRLLILS